MLFFLKNCDIRYNRVSATKQIIKLVYTTIGKEGILMKKQNGITLVALSITIIVLLILAGVSIVILIGNNGIITQANNAKDETRGGAVQEARDLWKATQKIDEQTKSETAQTLEKLIDDLVKQKLLKEK